jgi:hypothetical protein
MSTFIATILAAMQPVLAVSPFDAFLVVLGLALLSALLVLFKPLLLGLLRVALFMLKSNSGKEQRLARRQMREANIVNHLINTMDSSAPSHAAEIRAMASRS